MATKNDHLFASLEALRPEVSQQDSAWYIGRRESVLRRVRAHATAPSQARPPRTRRRVLAAGGLALALAGGGVAWANLPQFTQWYTGGSGDGLTCMTAWGPLTTEERPDQYGGATLTGDPIADCDRYAELTAKPRITDPIAVRLDGHLVVGPRVGVPDKAAPWDQWAAPRPTADPTAVLPHADATRDAARELELARSLDDTVDGGQSQCFDATTGSAFAAGELDRLGLRNWRVDVADQRVLNGGTAAPQEECAFFFVSEPGVVHVRTHGQSDPTAGRRAVTTGLREQIADQCLTLSEAEAATASLLADETRFEPTVTIDDPTTECTRVDHVVHGSQQVILYGPRR